MLYLEDYLEMIEHLPQELRDRFTEMREMDLSVQNNMDSIHCRSNGLFASCRQVDVPTAEHESEHNSIKSAYVKVIEDADEKVNLANQMYDLVERYLRRLDSELYKFKCELEADHNGITEILEKRSLELDGISSTPITGNQKENRYFGVISSGHDRRDRYRPKPEKRRDSGVGVTLASIPEKRPSLSSQISNSSPSLNIRPNTPNVNAHHTVLPQTPTGTPSSVSYNLQHIGAGNAIAAAASQAIVATQQMQQGRRTASLKASYEAIHGTSGGGELLIGREFAGATHNAIQAVEREGSSLNNPRRTKKKLNASGMSQHQQSPIASSQQQQQPSLVTTPTSSTTNLNNAINQVYVSTTNNISVVNAGAVITTNASSTPTQSLPVNMLDGISNMGGSNSSVGSATSSSAASGAVMMNDGGIAIETTPEGDWLYDPNEPRYCVCNQVSYGDMVACDNENCPFEWFHYPCVGITQSPKGKWYCPKCTLTMKRRSRKN